MSDERIGWIGLGKLGLPIAGRIVEAGHEVAGFDTAADRLDLARGKGIGAVSAREAAACAMVFSCLPDDRALRAALAGGEGAIAAMRPGAILVEISTVSPEASEEIAAEAERAGIAYLRLPISGNASIAHTGNLSCFASGPRDAFERALPVLRTFTKAQAYLGPAEEARYAKLSINLMLAATAVMMGESLALARRGNIAWQDILDVMENSAAASPMVKYKVGPLAERDFSSTFSCTQMVKDLDLILGAGHGGGVAMPLTALVRETYGAIVSRGLGAEDFIAPVKHSEWLSGLDEPERPSSSGD